MTNKNINKSNWKLTKFGSVVTQQKESIDIDKRAVGTRFIAGEHIDSEDIHIKKWGIVDESYLGPAFHRTFKKSDILYGSRRTYLKKVAVAHFDGITSNTTFVIQPNKDLVDDRLIPFLMLSDKFTKHSIKNSKGSVNPYINWKDIADFEFLLPPLNEQKKIADLLWNGDLLIQNRKKLLQNYFKYRLSSYKKLFENHKINNSIKDLPIKVITGLWKGKSNNLVPVNVIRNTEFDSFGELNLNKLQEIMVDKDDYDKKALLHEDVIVEMSGGSDDQPVGRVVWFDKQTKPFSFSNFTKTIRVVNKNIVLPKYLFYFLLYCYEKGLTARLENQTTGIRNLDFERYLKISIDVPSAKEQQGIVNLVDSIENVRKDIQKLISKEEELLNNIVNKFF